MANLDSFSFYADTFARKNIVVDSKGVQYAAYAVYPSSGSYYCKVMKSTDNGATWVNTNIPQISGYNQANIKLLVDSADNIYAFWQGRDSTNTINFVVKKAIYNGSSWSSIESISAAGVTDFVCCIAPNNTIHIIYYLNGPGNHIIYTTSWSSPVSNVGVSGGTGMSAIASDVSNNIHYVYNDGSGNFQYKKYTGTWGTATQIQTGTAEFIDIVVDKNNVIHTAFTLLLNGTTFNRKLVYLRNNGSWQTPVTVYYPSTTTDVVITSPEISLDNINNVYIFASASYNSGTDNFNRYFKSTNYTTFADNHLASASGPASYVCATLLPYQGNLYYIQAVGTSPTTLTSGSVIVDLAPTAPTNVTIPNFDATGVQAVTWTFNDPDVGDGQSAFELIITKVSDGTTVLDTGKVINTASLYNIAANTLVNETQYQAKVRTWDKSDLVGPYSTLVTFWASAKPILTFTNPTSDGSTNSTSGITLTWAITDQGFYQMQLLDSTGVTVLSDSGKVSGSASTYTIPYTLVNNTTYRIKGQIWDSYGIASNIINWSLVVSYSAPAQPTIILTNNADNISVTINNPTPSGSQPAVSYNDIFKRKLGDANFYRIATNMPNNGQIKDYAVASGQVYEYKVRAVSATQTTTDSQSKSSSITFNCVYLHDTTNPAGTCHGFLLSPATKASTNQKELILMQYAGRTKKVAQFGIATTRDITFTLSLLSNNTADEVALTSLVDARSTLCYRDNRGRIIFGVIGAESLADNSTGKDSLLKIEETDYSEVV